MRSPPKLQKSYLLSDEELFAYVFGAVRDQRGNSNFGGRLDITNLLESWSLDRIQKPSIQDFQEALQSSPQHNWPIELGRTQVWENLKSKPFYRAFELAVWAVQAVDLPAHQVVGVLVDIARSFDEPSNRFYDAIYFRFIDKARSRFDDLLNHAIGEYKKMMALERANGAVQPEILAPAVATPAPPVESSLGLRPCPWPAEYTLTDHGYYCAAGVSIWFATHRGPAYSQKSENQDFVHVECSDDSISFAVTDGVSTSFASRFAAVAAAANFCAFVAKQGDPSFSPENMLRSAAASTQAWLTQAMDYLEATPSGSEWKQVRGVDDLEEIVIRAAFANTRNRKQNWSPVLATTLIGGTIRRSADGTLQVDAIRIGDGQIEAVDHGDLGNATRLLAMDADEAQIQYALCPGPLGISSVQAAEYHQLLIRPKQMLLVTTDGLTRGHNDPVGRKLATLLPDNPFIGAPNPAAAAIVLETAAKHADAVYARNHDSQLFPDNITLLIAIPN